MASDRKRLASPAVYLTGLFLIGVAAKSLVVFWSLPSIWLWRDQLYYATTAFDLGHPGSLGVPHPGFLFYPPLTSVLLLPVFRLGFSPDVAYPIALVWQNALLTSTIFAAHVLYREVFQAESRFVPAFLLFAAPAYTALMLMSEPLFITLYAWSLVFFAKAVRFHRMRDYLLVGLLAGLMALTRRVGPAIGAALLLCYVVEGYSARSRTGSGWRVSAPILSVALALGIPVVWGLARSHLVETELGGLSLSTYLRAGVFEPLTVPGEFFSFARRLAANVGYVSLATFGVLVPAAIWALVGQADPREDSFPLRLVALNVLVVLLITALAAGMHMYISRDSWLPRYDMYGRYVEHATLPIAVLGFGCLERLRMARGDARARVLVLICLLGVASAMVLPQDFFARSMRGQIAPNSLGIAMLIRFADGNPAWWIITTTGAMVAGWILMMPSRPRVRVVRSVMLAVLLLLSVWNYGVAVTEVSKASHGARRYHAEYSTWVGEHPELFRNGLYVDFRTKGRFKDRAGNARMFHVLFEHLDRVIAGEDPEAYLGRIPVLTKEVLQGYEVVFEDQRTGYRIYGTESQPKGPD